MRVTLLLMLLVTASFASASEWKPLSGTYAVTAESYLDPPEGENPRSHYRFQLTGESAKDLYEAMSAEAIVDDCTGARAKNLGNMQCLYFEADARFDCHFSINLVNQEIESGVAC